MYLGRQAGRHLWGKLHRVCKITQQFAFRTFKENSAMVKKKKFFFFLGKAK